jgi:4-hydroxy-tetrahydrodipicolinate reductase
VKLALLGSSGRMGSALQRLASSANHEIVATFDIDTNPGGPTLRDALGNADVVIDFTQPDCILQNIEEVAQAGLPMVVGTTGWYGALDQVRKIVDRCGTGLVWGANFSIGALLLMRLTKHAAAFLDRFPEYDPYVVEHHHRGKHDAPSGTGRRLAEEIVGSMACKHQVIEGNPHGKIPPDALHVASVRAGEAFGTHTVGFDASVETLKLTHTARGRDGFAVGALYAAELIQNRTGVYEFSELFNEVPKI